MQASKEWRERGGKRQREKKREREWVCVCVWGGGGGSKYSASSAVLKSTD